MASDLPSAQDILASIVAEIGPIPIEVLSAGELRRVDPVVERLAGTRTGGVVVLMADDPGASALARTRLARLERSGLLVEVISVMSAEGYLCIARTRSMAPARRTTRPPPVDTPASPPVTSATIEDIDVRRAASRRPTDPVDLDGADGVHGRLHALGVAWEDAGVVRPTVAGLAMYGIRPELWLPGLHVQVRKGQSGLSSVRGSIPTIVRQASAFLPLPQRIGAALIAAALVRRDLGVDEPIAVSIDGSRIEVRVPATDRLDTVSRRLAAREGLVPSEGDLLGPLARWLSEVGMPRVSVLRVDTRVCWVFDLPPEHLPDLRRRANPQPSLAVFPEPVEGPPPEVVASVANGVEPPPPAIDHNPGVHRSGASDDAPEAEVADTSDAESRGPASGRPRVAPHRVEALARRLERGPATTKELMADLDASRAVIRAALQVLQLEGRVTAQEDTRSSPSQRWCLVGMT